jgi:hypothetical protein
VNETAGEAPSRQADTVEEDWRFCYLGSAAFLIDDAPSSVHA